MASKKRLTDAQLWQRLQDDAELERIKHLSSAALDAEIRADGGDPDAIGRRGGALAEKLLAERGLDWTDRAKARADELKRKAGDWPSFEGLKRSELIEAIRATLASARFAAPVVAAFRKRSGDEATEQELRGVLEELEVLRRLHGRDDE